MRRKDDNILRLNVFSNEKRCGEKNNRETVAE